MPRETDFKQVLCADSNGLSLHTAVRCAARPTTAGRRALEQLCRYITRPALANERLQTNAAGQVVLKLKTPWRDGTTHPVMSPLESKKLLIQRPLCGRRIRRCYVSRGSVTACQPRSVAGGWTAHCRHSAWEAEGRVRVGYQQMI